MNCYEYNGPVLEFNTCVMHNFKAKTYAETAKKAKSNIAYQYKKLNNRIASTRVTLPNDVVLVN